MRIYHALVNNVLFAGVGLEWFIQALAVGF